MAKRKRPAHEQEVLDEFRNKLPMGREGLQKERAVMDARLLGLKAGGVGGMIGGAIKGIPGGVPGIAAGAALGGIAGAGGGQVAGVAKAFLRGPILRARVRRAEKKLQRDAIDAMHPKAK